MSCTVISICNHKGGVAKTTSVVNLAAALAEQNRKVLVLDMDPQGNSTMVLYSGDPFKTEKTSIQFFTQAESSFYSLQQPSKVKNVAIIPTNLNMLKVEKDIMGTHKMVAALKQKFDDETQKEFDYVLIDCPPNLGSFVTNALVVSDFYIVPIGAEDHFALKGLEDMINHAKDIQVGFNTKLSLMGILITLYDERTTVSKVQKVEIQSFFGKENIFKTMINRNTALNQAVIKRKTIFQHDPRASGTTDYRNLAKEVIENVEKRRTNAGRAADAAHTGLASVGA